MDGFFARRTTNVVPVQTPDPSAFRSGLAGGLQALGEAGSRVAANEQAVEDQREASEYRLAAEEQRRRRSAMVADRMGAWAEVQAEVTTERDRLRQESTAGAYDYAEKADKLLTDRMQSFLATLGDDPEIRERFEPVIAGWSANARVDDSRWAIARRTEYEGQRVDTWRDSAGNALLADPTPGKLQQAFDESDMLLDTLDVPGGVREELKRQTKRGFVVNFLDARLGKDDWQGVRSLMQGKAFDDFLKPEDKIRYSNRADQGEAVAQRQAEIAESQRRDAARDMAKAVQAKIDAGIVPSEPEMRSARQALAAAGADPAELIAFDATSVQVEVNRRYQGTDSETMRRDRATIDAKMRAGRASEAEQVMARQLDKLIDSADTRETEQVRELMGKGVAGQTQALSMLTGSAEARYAKANKLEDGLGFVANLNTKAQTYALEGRELRKARPKDFGDDKQVRATVDAMVGPLGLALGGQYGELVDTAWSIMATSQARTGSAGFDADKLRMAVRIATGATHRPNGIVQGGIQRVRGKPVHLPENMTPDEFDAYMSRRDFSAGAYANGRPAQKADVLQNYRPEWAGDDPRGRPLYRFVDATGGVLANKGGGSLLMRVESGK